MRLDKSKRGVTLIETIFVLALVSIVVGLGMSTLKPGAKKTAPVGLAMALADEFRSARSLAIRSGHPVAVGIPIDGSRVSTSTYRLEGWNIPYVSDSRSYDGDYTGYGFAAASWSGAPSVTVPSTTLPPISKMHLFDITDWIPAAHAADAVFCYTPDGALVANSQPAVSNRHTLVVAEGLVTSGTEAVGGNEAAVVYLGLAGGVEVEARLLGGNLGPGAAVAPGAVELRTEFNTRARVTLSNIIVLPDPGSTTVDGFCVPGQQVTMEMYAYEERGRQLFAKWTEANNQGNFTFPTAAVDPTTGLERMEWVDEVPASVTWPPGATAPTGGAWRSRWAWTVPITSLPGDSYALEADVDDASGNAIIDNPPNLNFAPQVSPPGRLIVERLKEPPAPPNTWELVQMNPDGSGEKVLSAANVEEKLPTIDRSGTRMAFLQRAIGAGGWDVKVRALAGGNEQTIAAGGDFTSVSISPDGRWVSYRDNGAGELITRETRPATSVPPPVEFRRPQTWGAGNKSRTGWSKDGNLMLWCNGSTMVITPVGFGDNPNDVANDTVYITEMANNAPAPLTGNVFENLFAPTTFIPPGPGSVERIMFTIGSTNSVLAHVPLRPDFAVNPLGNMHMDAGSPDLIHPILDGPGSVGSADSEDDYPSISSDNTNMFLVLPRADIGGANRRADLVPWTGANFVAPATATINQDIRSVIWVP